MGAQPSSVSTKLLINAPVQKAGAFSCPTNRMGRQRVVITIYICHALRIPRRFNQKAVTSFSPHIPDIIRLNQHRPVYNIHIESSTFAEGEWAMIPQANSDLICRFAELEGRVRTPEHTGTIQN